jgi:hypothetical protein
MIANILMIFIAIINLLAIFLIFLTDSDFEYPPLFKNKRPSNDKE